ncbi:MAG: hypothetical protein R3Y11_12745 [Pseudomonadota bacterium]
MQLEDGLPRHSAGTPFVDFELRASLLAMTSTGYGNVVLGCLSRCDGG